MRSVASRDLTTYPSAPVFRQARTKSASSCTVRKTIAGVLPDSTSLVTASIPLREGIEMSVTTRSGFSRSTMSTSASPSRTTPTTWYLGSNRLATASKTSGRSSAKTMRTRINFLPRAPSGSRLTVHSLRLSHIGWVVHQCSESSGIWGGGATGYITSAPFGRTTTRAA